ncbi:hypothetical protein AAHE18_03G059900 [Arachis hypogaea]
MNMVVPCLVLVALVMNTVVLCLVSCLRNSTTKKWNIVDGHRIEIINSLSLFLLENKHHPDPSAPSYDHMGKKMKLHTSIHPLILILSSHK